MSELSRNFWNLLEYFGTFQKILEYSGTFQKRSETFRNVLENSGTFRNFLETCGTCSNILEHSRKLWNIPELLRQFQTFMSYNILSYSHISMTHRHTPSLTTFQSILGILIRKQCVSQRQINSSLPQISATHFDPRTATATKFSHYR